MDSMIIQELLIAIATIVIYAGGMIYSLHRCDKKSCNNAKKDDIKGASRTIAEKKADITASQNA